MPGRAQLPELPILPIFAMVTGARVADSADFRARVETYDGM
ncbi:MAG: hypothetical protein OJF49_003869 [Ktedonobacterales bacterium]|nr:MAG: hypothetical protein OJF49_003869 [Ktedonobacterales bacterium]